MGSEKTVRIKTHCGSSILSLYITEKAPVYIRRLFWGLDSAVRRLQDIDLGTKSSKMRLACSYALY